MIVAIPMIENNVDAKMDDKFGRSRYLMVYNTDDKKAMEFIDNTQAMEKGCNAENLTKYLNEINADAVISMSAGSNSIKWLMKSGLKLYKAPDNDAMKNVERMLDGKLETLDKSNCTL